MEVLLWAWELMWTVNHNNNKDKKVLFSRQASMCMQILWLNYLHGCLGQIKQNWYFKTLLKTIFLEHQSFSFGLYYFNLNYYSIEIFIFQMLKSCAILSLTVLSSPGIGKTKSRHFPRTRLNTSNVSMDIWRCPSLFTSCIALAKLLKSTTFDQVYEKMY